MIQSFFLNFVLYDSILFVKKETMIEIQKRFSQCGKLKMNKIIFGEVR